MHTCIHYGDDHKVIEYPQKLNVAGKGGHAVGNMHDGSSLQLQDCASLTSINNAVRWIIMQHSSIICYVVTLRKLFQEANTWSLYMTTADYQSSFSFEYIIHVSIVRYYLHIIKVATYM